MRSYSNQKWQSKRNHTLLEDSTSLTCTSQCSEYVNAFKKVVSVRTNIAKKCLESNRLKKQNRD